MKRALRFMDGGEIRPDATFNYRKLAPNDIVICGRVWIASLACLDRARHSGAEVNAVSEEGIYLVVHRYTQGESRSFGFVSHLLNGRGSLF